MKKIIVFLLGVFFGLFHAQNSQNFNILYKVTYLPSSNDTARNIEYMTLEVSSFKSRFYNTEKKQLDSLVQINSPAIHDDTALPKLNFEVYKDLANKKMLIGANFNQFQYFFNENKVNWKFIKTPKIKLENYNIKQAEATYGRRTWIVLYIEDIPIFDGPYVFSGLPGLVYKAMSTDREYVFEMMSIKKMTDPLPVKIPKANTEKQKIIAQLKSFTSNPTMQNITYMNIWGDSFYYEWSKANPKAKQENEKKIVGILSQFNNPPDKDLPIINLF